MGDGSITSPASARQLMMLTLRNPSIVAQAPRDNRKNTAIASTTTRAPSHSILVTIGCCAKPGEASPFAESCRNDPVEDPMRSW